VKLFVLQCLSDRTHTLGVCSFCVAVWLIGLLSFVFAQVAIANPPNPQLSSIFPAGAKVGSTIEVTATGAGLGQALAIYCSDSRIQSKLTGKKLLVTVPAEVPVGHYDMYAVTKTGLSSPRTFIVGNRNETVESASNDALKTAQAVELDTVVNGRIEKAGDRDCFQFTAKKGQLVVLECNAERLDSKLRAVLELFDAAGKRIGVSRGFYGVDPLIDFRVPNDGTYVVRVDDRVFSGSADHVYRLCIDTGPRVAFAYPPVICESGPNEVALWGWNLDQLVDQKVDSVRRFESAEKSDSESQRYDSVRVKLRAKTSELNRGTLRLGSTQSQSDLIAYHLDQIHAPIALSRVESVQMSSGSNRAAESALDIRFPVEVVGQLLKGDQVDWFAIEAVRGDVLYFEAFGQRIGSPVDIDIAVLNSAMKRVAQFSDQVANVGGKRLPSNHLDPSGRCVIPQTGRYFVSVRNLIGGLKSDPRRIYRLSIQREVPDVVALIVPRLDAPAAVNILGNGRSVLDVVAFRRRGMTGSIRLQATQLPPGYECPDVWLGPGVNRAPLVLSVRPDANESVGLLAFKVEDEHGMEFPTRVSSSSIVRTGRPNGWSRLTDVLPAKMSGKSQVKITADAHEIRKHHLYGNLKPRHSPGGMVDVAVQVDRLDLEFQAPVELIGIGIPLPIKNCTGTIGVGESSTQLSFYLPQTLSPGRYTIAIQGKTTVPTGPKGKDGKWKTKSVTIVSNPVTIDVRPATFVVELDPYAPKRIRRGQIVQVKYTARRINGFIGKIHTELYAAGEVVGLRGRGVTFVGQTESGSIQVIANEDAPLGRQESLRLFGVGVVEDEAVYHGSCFLPLEIVK
jgi:hypothetical protein